MYVHLRLITCKLFFSYLKSRKKHNDHVRKLFTLRGKEIKTLADIFRAPGKGISKLPPANWIYSWKPGIRTSFYCDRTWWSYQFNSSHSYSSTYLNWFLITDFCWQGIFRNSIRPRLGQSKPLKSNGVKKSPTQVEICEWPGWRIISFLRSMLDQPRNLQVRAEAILLENPDLKQSCSIRNSKNRTFSLSGSGLLIHNWIADFPIANWEHDFLHLESGVIRQRRIVMK